MSSGKPPRLERVFQKYNPPLYFVTFCTARRRKILANEAVHRVLVEYGRRGEAHGVALGRYVIMPNHVHLFVRGTHEFRLSIWMRGLKRVVAAAVAGGRKVDLPMDAACPAAGDGRQLQRPVKTDSESSIWQRGFFDHLLRNSDSYSQKWQYVEQNPVRAGLVSKTEDWPYAGEIVYIDRV